MNRCRSCGGEVPFGEKRRFCWPACFIKHEFRGRTGVSVDVRKTGRAGELSFFE